ncbi:oxidoreductase [Paenibacillus darwinianus]|uniref:Oxidoreductase n=1 Tax=Paenibacillus darwinianus TaxID=1380763 RepID=A0A9W5W821_9BACL|nr:Gfo/Idh/MocA family oxidoreductase [Paenibacillus darwinianus]EXX87112.1 oxidoreductase [Paenibacillus darwinianus]EXX90553.1 oxidoreductase [Paenibacillus darwinianus]EXX90600.1 oxidoreductase [Paenibacillus darwinianus]
MDKVKVGMIGTGNISGIYFQNGGRFESMEIAACADLDVERAKVKAAEHGVRGCSVEQLLADPEIEMVINLTIPAAHAPVCIQALEAGKHVYVEKPLSVTREDAARMLDIARSKNLLVGCAPDTFLGAGIQTCIKLIEDGAIGTPIGATAFMMSGGTESWHPAPEFFYKTGGGPMFDMGPYYLTALIAMLGPISRVTGSARISYPERLITSEPLRGQRITVDVPTHVAGIIDFAAGPIGTILTSFDVKGGSVLPRIEVYGSEGTLVVPDPNMFGGEIRLSRAGSREWTDIALTHANAENARGIGAADMAKAIRTGRSYRAAGELAYHVLEAMHGFHDASEQGRHYAMRSTCAKPAPLPAGLADYELD